MLVRPDDVADSDVKQAVESGWGKSVDSIDYFAAGFGSHHWVAETPSGRLFLSVDRASPKTADLAAVLATVTDLRDRGLDFVVAPERSRRGNVCEPLGANYLVAVYPFVHGASASQYATRAERHGVVERLAVLHRTQAPHHLPVIDLAIEARQSLEAALDELSSPWATGPFADLARTRLRGVEPSLREALRRYDQLAASAMTKGDLVVTHGEPHRGNVLIDGDHHWLVDWDTCRLAHPERDLWALCIEDPSLQADYQHLSDRGLSPTILEMYRLRWDLSDVALYVADFRLPHDDNADSRTAWDGLVHHLDRALGASFFT